MTDWQPGMLITAERLNGVIMEWTPLTSLGAFATNYGPGNPEPRMRKISDRGTEVWEFEGEITTASFTAGSAFTAFTFNSGHIVADTRGCQVYAKGGSTAGCRLALLSSGTLQLANPSDGGSVSAVLIDGVRITNPLTS